MTLPGCGLCLDCRLFWLLNREFVIVKFFGSKRKNSLLFLSPQRLLILEIIQVLSAIYLVAATLLMPLLVNLHVVVADMSIRPLFHQNRISWLTILFIFRPSIENLLRAVDVAIFYQRCFGNRGEGGLNLIFLGFCLNLRLHAFVLVPRNNFGVYTSELRSLPLWLFTVDQLLYLGLKLLLFFLHQLQIFLVVIAR